MAGNLKACLAEFIGTFAIVLFGAGAVLVDAATQGRLGQTGIALSHGLALGAMMLIYANGSAGHFNPAVTLAKALLKRIDALTAVCFGVVQLLGAALAVMALSASLKGFPQMAETPPYLGACAISGIGFKAATLLEAIGTFFLVAGALGDPKDSVIHSLKAGLLWMAAILALGPVTGGAFNPARAFGPSVISGYWQHWYVYWIGPFAGAAASAWVHGYVFTPKK